MENYVLDKTISFHFLLNLSISDKSKTFLDLKNPTTHHCF